ncbi:hypothetical protein PV04_02187 [Phialophora macrospora]|uniref:Amine oxidase domain-containing protein n=1 Tax=Phialophora macrospora TaxID=1851006 RepID=A0A0D2FTL6_9EURO|nr:hypothetical protein PV04_02187 [Phialophora macrospora]
MMLKYLGITNVDIFEASDRVGGRSFTRGLSGGDDYHNYYDVGAMRIPQIDWMKHVLDFIDRLGLQASRQEYVYDNNDVPSSYWYSTEAKFMGPIVAGFTQNFNLAFAKWLTTSNDNYSTRSFLMAGPQDEAHPESSASIPQSTGLFDQSITETLIDYADFQAAKTSKWWRVDGGMQRVAEAMQSHLLSIDWPEPGSTAIKVTTGSPVTALSHDKQAKKIGVTVAGGQAVDYDMVFNTTAMGPLQRMDLHGLGLPDKILTGIRSLSYDRATKVVIRFTKPWWCATDLPISNVVYPSWNDGPDHPAALMVSYSWAQDATRMASLVPDYTVVTPKKDDPIVTFCLQNLAMLWKDRIRAADLFKDLSDMYMTHHAWALGERPRTPATCSAGCGQVIRPTPLRHLTRWHSTGWQPIPSGGQQNIQTTKVEIMARRRLAVFARSSRPFERNLLATSIECEVSKVTK